METLSKSEFARRIGVTPTRVGQYLREGYIGPDCLEGEGRGAKIVVALAVEAIRRRRNIGQALGNGLATRLDEDSSPSDSDETPTAAPPQSRVVPFSPRSASIEDQIKAERLEGDRRKNRREAQEEAVRLGKLVLASDVRVQMTKAIKAMDEEAAGMLADFATAIAAEFHLQQRDVLHLLRRIRNERKAGVADRARARAEATPKTVKIQMEDAGGD